MDLSRDSYTPLDRTFVGLSVFVNAMTDEGRHKRVKVHLMEIDHGGFCREVELPEDVDRGRITARDVLGVTVVLHGAATIRERFSLH